MAPKRSHKVMSTVMTTRSKVVREIVQVAVVESAQKPTIGDIDEEKLEDTFIPSGKKPLRTIAVEDMSEQRNQSAQIPVLMDDKSSEQENQSFPVQVEGKSKEENQPVQPPVEKKSEEENQGKSPEENQAEVQVPEEEKEKGPTTMTSEKQKGPSKKEKGKKKTKNTQEGEGKGRKRRRKAGGGEEYRRTCSRGWRRRQRCCLNTQAERRYLQGRFKGQCGWYCPESLESMPLLRGPRL
ncbi:histone H2B.2-like isoform X2 [Carya illinoinensis]|uniref:histone H2B.2-like isoform X2 n=1 Tax=Carya illinoinensis TaxID=32201 RepID=UPI001C724B42|nr:histone H2B.2-like isoform X2 [Carya illinoinensis]